MSDAPSKSNENIDVPRRGIGRFLWLNAVMTTLGCVAVGLFFDNVYVLYPAAFGMLIGGVVIIFREMFALLGEDSQYAPPSGEAATADTPSSSAAARGTVGATAHAA